MIPVLLFIIFILAIYYTVQPFFLDSIEIPEEGANPKELSKKRRLVNIFKQIRETEFEHDMGIIADEDFERMNNELKFEASSLLDNTEEVTEKIQKCKNCMAKTSKNDTFCSNCGVNVKDKNCNNCQNKLNENDQFCSQCGAGIS